MFSYGTLTPATFQIYGSTPTPSYNYIWAARPSSQSAAFLISTDGINWYKKGNISGSLSSNGQPMIGFNESTKEIIQYNGSTTSVYNINSDLVTSYNTSSPWGGNIAGGIGQVTYDNTRNCWGASSNWGYNNTGGGVGKNTSQYITTTGANAQKLWNRGCHYKIITSPSGNVMIIPLCVGVYCYFLPSGSDFVTGTYTNLWSGLNNAAIAAGISNKKMVGGCYFPNIGFVIILVNGVAIYDDINDSWTAQTVSWGNLKADMASNYTGADYYQNMTTYEPNRNRIYTLHYLTTGYLRVFYSDDGLNWSLLGTQTNSNMPDAGNYNYTKNIAADNNHVIAYGNNSYSLYDYNTDTWTKNSGLNLNGQSFLNNTHIYCFPYTND